MKSRLLKNFLFVRAISFGDCSWCGCPTRVGRWDDGNDVIYCENPDCPVGILWKWDESELVN